MKEIIPRCNGLGGQRQEGQRNSYNRNYVLISSREVDTTLGIWKVDAGSTIPRKKKLRENKCPVVDITQEYYGKIVVPYINIFITKSSTKA